MGGFARFPRASRAPGGAPDRTGTSVVLGARVNAGSQAPWFGAVIDGENVFSPAEGRLPLSTAQDVYRQIDPQVYGMEVVWAGCPRLLAAHRPLLTARGFSTLEVERRKDAADFSLLSAAYGMLARGCVGLVVVSGDGIFAQLASHTLLVVVSYADRLAAGLASAALVVNLLRPISSVYPVAA